METQSRYAHLLESHGLDSTPNRLSILEILANSNTPLSAGEIFRTLQRTRRVNRVTVYRILDLLVDNNLAERIHAGDRSYRYGFTAKRGHHLHPHFYCTHCGNMECLHTEGVHLDLEALERTYPGVIQKVEIRLDGVCKNCLKRNGGEG